MMVAMRPISEEGSEPDLDLHVSDTDDIDEFKDLNASLEDELLQEPAESNEEMKNGEVETSGLVAENGLNEKEGEETLPTDGSNTPDANADDADDKIDTEAKADGDIQPEVDDEISPETDFEVTLKEHDKDHEDMKVDDEDFKIVNEENKEDEELKGDAELIEDNKEDEDVKEDDKEDEEVKEDNKEDEKMKEDNKHEKEDDLLCVMEEKPMENDVIGKDDDDSSKSSTPSVTDEVGRTSPEVHGDELMDIGDNVVETGETDSVVEAEPEPESEAPQEMELETEPEAPTVTEVEPEAGEEDKPDSPVEAIPEVEPSAPTADEAPFTIATTTSMEADIEPEAEAETGEEPAHEIEVAPNPETEAEPSSDMELEPNTEMEIAPNPEVEVEPEPETELANPLIETQSEAEPLNEDRVDDATKPEVPELEKAVEIQTQTDPEVEPTPEVPELEKAVEIQTQTDPEVEPTPEVQLVSPDMTVVDITVDVCGSDNKENIPRDNKRDAELEMAVNNIPNVSTSISTATSQDVATRNVNLRKRQSADSIDLSDTKKFKAAPLASMKKTSSLAKFMVDKSLKGMTREKLEAFVVQKMCEAMVYKSQVADLKKLVHDCMTNMEELRRGITTVSKVAKDQHIVHDKLLQDLERFKKNPAKPLMIPRITRSVGLQVGRETFKKQEVTSSLSASLSGPPKLTPSTTLLQKTLKAAPSTPTLTKLATSPKLTPVAHTLKTPVKSPVITRQAIAKAPVKPAPPRTPPKKPSADVIDLTSDEDKKLTRLPSGSKLVPPPNGHKFVLVNGQSVMVKLATQSNFVMPQNAVKFVTTTAPIRAIPSTVLKTTNTTTNTKTVSATSTKMKARVSLKAHAPPPFPITQPNKPGLSRKPVPPSPQLTLTRTKDGSGIVLSWDMPKLDLYEDITSYQLYAYHEKGGDQNGDKWGKIGDVKSLPLPMAVTLTHCGSGNRYYFAVRAIDALLRVGPFSDYQMITLGQ